MTIRTEPRDFKVVCCFDCGYVGNRAEKVEDVGPGGVTETLHCPECGEPCGPYFKVVEAQDVA